MTEKAVVNGHLHTDGQRQAPRIPANQGGVAAASHFVDPHLPYSGPSIPRDLDDRIELLREHLPLRTLLNLYAHLGSAVAKLDSDNKEPHWPTISKNLREAFCLGKNASLETIKFLFDPDGKVLRTMYGKLSQIHKEEAARIGSHRDYINSSEAKRLSLVLITRFTQWRLLEDNVGHRADFQRAKEAFVKAKKKEDVQDLIKGLNEAIADYYHEGKQTRFPDVFKTFIPFFRLHYQKYGFVMPAETVGRNGASKDAVQSENGSRDTSMSSVSDTQEETSVSTTDQSSPSKADGGGMDGAPPRLTLPSIGTRKAEEETSAINADEDKAAKEASEVPTTSTASAAGNEELGRAVMQKDAAPPSKADIPNLVETSLVLADIPLPQDASDSSGASHDLASPISPPPSPKPAPSLNPDATESDNAGNMSPPTAPANLPVATNIPEEVSVQASVQSTIPETLPASTEPVSAPDRIAGNSSNRTTRKRPAPLLLPLINTKKVIATKARAQAKKAARKAENGESQTNDTVVPPGAHSQDVVEPEQKKSRKSYDDNQDSLVKEHANATETVQDTAVDTAPSGIHDVPQADVGGYPEYVATGSAPPGSKSSSRSARKASLAVKVVLTTSANEISPPLPTDNSPQEVKGNSVTDIKEAYFHRFEQYNATRTPLVDGCLPALRWIVCSLFLQKPEDIMDYDPFKIPVSPDLAKNYSKFIKEQRKILAMKRYESVQRCRWCETEFHAREASSHSLTTLATMLAKPNPNMEEALRILRLIPANAMAFNHFQTEIYTGSEDLLALTLQWIKILRAFSTSRPVVDEVIDGLEEDEKVLRIDDGIKTIELMEVADDEPIILSSAAKSTKAVNPKKGKVNLATSSISSASSIGKPKDGSKSAKNLRTRATRQ